MIHFISFIEFTQKQLQRIIYLSVQIIAQNLVLTVNPRNQTGQHLQAVKVSHLWRPLGWHSIAMRTVFYSLPVVRFVTSQYDVLQQSPVQMSQRNRAGCIALRRTVDHLKLDRFVEQLYNTNTTRKVFLDSLNYVQLPKTFLRNVLSVFTSSSVGRPGTHNIVCTCTFLIDVFVIVYIFFYVCVFYDSE